MNVSVKYLKINQYLFALLFSPCSKLNANATATSATQTPTSKYIEKISNLIILHFLFFLKPRSTKPTGRTQEPAEGLNQCDQRERA